MPVFRSYILGATHYCRHVAARIAVAGCFLSFAGGVSLRALAVEPEAGHGADVVSADLVSVADSLDEFRQTIYFPISTSTIDVAFTSNPSALDSIRRFFAGIDSTNCLDVLIEGSASPDGDRRFNEELAMKRAQALKMAIAVSASVPVTLKWGVATGTPRRSWPEERSAALTVRMLSAPSQGVVIPGCETAGADTLRVADETGLSGTPAFYGKSDKSDKSGGSDLQTAGLPQGARVRCPFFLKTNLLYDAALVPNLGIGVCFADRLTVYADWMHAWWRNHPERRYWRVYGGDLEVSWQLGHGKGDNVFSGHRVGVYGSIVTYDFQFGRSCTGVIGDKYNYAVGISYGYSLPVARRLNIDFGIGVGYMWGRYMKHHVVDDHDVWQSTHNRSWVGPTKIEIGLTWLLGRGNVNGKREGGRR